MKKLLIFILLSISPMLLAACDNGGNSASQAGAMKQAGLMRDNQMQPLQQLVNQALITAAYGANLKLDGDAHGQALLADAGALLRRALSGPEMAMMHKGGQGMSDGMKRTHDMGDAAFDLLGLMMALTPDAADASGLRKRNEQLAMAASGAVMLMQAQSGGDLKPVMQDHARRLMQQAAQSFATMQGGGAYHALLGRLLSLLGATPPAG